MSKTARNIFFGIVSIQILIAFFLLYQIYQEKNNVLGVVSINPIKKEDIIFSDESVTDLKFFYEPTPGIRTNEEEWLSYIASYTINNDSLNERFNYEIDKSKNTYRIITIGDSHTFGMYVNTQDNWTELLENQLNTNYKCENINEFEVINLGVGGYDIEYAVERFRKRGQKYNPNLVLWLIKDDDFKINNELMKPLIDLSRKEFKSSGTVKTGDYPWNKKVIEEINDKFGEETILSHQEQALQKIDDYFKKDLIILTYPRADEKYKKIITDFVKSRQNTYFFDTLPAIYKPEMSYARLADGHPSLEGHKLIASSVFDYLTKSGLIPCQ